MAFVGYFNSAPHLNEALDRAARKFESFAASKKFLGSVFIFILICMMYSSTKGLSVYDEGLICYGAERVLGGDLPYRDFWTAYGPGQYYLLAGVFKIFGTSLLAARMYCVSVEWIVAILAYLISRRLTGPVGGVLSFVSVAVWLNCDRSVLYPVIPALAFALAGFLSLARSASIPNNIILAGVFTGCATVVRYDLGLYTFIGQSVILVGQSFVGPIGSEKPPSQASGKVKRLLIYIVAASAVVLPTFLAFTQVVPRQMLYEIFVDFPLRIYPQFRSIPFPAPQNFGLIYGLPLLILITSAVFLPSMWLRYRPRNTENCLAVGLVLFGFAVFLSVRVRPDILHMVVPMVAPLILVPWLVQVMNASRTSRFAFISFSILLLMCVGRLMFDCTRRDVLYWRNGRAAEFVPVRINRATGISMRRDTDGLVEAVHYIQQKAPAGEPIYVGNTRHDEIFLNNALFYFLSGRRSATRFSELHPGIATTYKVQSEIIEEIKRQKVTYVVLWKAPRSSEPNRSSESSGVTILDDFIKANYEPIAGFGDYLILLSSGSRDTSGESTRGRHGDRRTIAQKAASPGAGHLSLWL
jgi:Dolichyl-phosphate-mannose-protein mannosyltransferase